MTGKKIDDPAFELLSAEKLTGNESFYCVREDTDLRILLSGLVGFHERKGLNAHPELDAAISAVASQLDGKQPKNSTLTALGALVVTELGRRLLTSHLIPFDALPPITANQVGAAPTSHNQPWNTITNTPITIAGYGIVDAAALVNGLIPTSLLPNDYLVNTTAVTTEGEMRALPFQRGDFCYRTDVAAYFDLIGTDPTLLASWRQRQASSLRSINQQTGPDVVLGAADVGALPANDPAVTNPRTPTGAAGGDLSGVFPNPSLSAAIRTALRDRSTHHGVSGGVVIYAADFGAKADLVYVQPTYNTATIISGTDTTANLQAALNAAGAMVPSDVNLDYEGCPRVVSPPGKCIVTKTLVVPPNVIFDTEHTVFFNFLSDDWAPLIHGSRHSHATILKAFLNNKSGIWWGDPNLPGVRCDSYIDAVWVEHGGVGYESSLPGNRQKCGLRLFGLWFRIGRIEVKEANIGLDLRASDVLCPAVFVMGAACAILLESAEQINLPSVCLDTNIATGIQINNSNHVRMFVQAFVNSDGYGTAMDRILRIGTYSGNICKAIFIDCVAVSTGGYMLEIANTTDSEFNLHATNARLYSQTSGYSFSAGRSTATSHWTPVNSGSTQGALLAHDLGTSYQPPGNEGTPAALVKYGPNLSGFLNINLWRPSGVTATEGTRYGNLTVNGVLPWTNISGQPTTLAGYGITDAVRLVNGLIPTSLLPNDYLVNTTAVATEGEMRALPFQRGDFCYRTDVAAYFDLIGTDPTLLASWRQRQASSLRSINQQTGPDVVLAAADVGAIPNTNNSVTDALIGNRTVDQAIAAAPANTGTITQLFGWVVNRIRALLGTANWFDTPPITLAATASHVASTSNPHGATAAQVGALAVANNLSDVTNRRTSRINLDIVTPTCKVHSTVNITLSDGVGSGIPFNATLYDSHGFLSTTAPTQLICRHEGVYNIVGCLSFASNATGHRSGYILLNGSAIGFLMIPPVASSGNVTILSVSASAYLRVGDVVVLFARQFSGGSLDVVSTGVYSPSLAMTYGGRNVA